MHATFASSASLPKIYLFTQIMAVIALLATLGLGLLPALLGGLLIYQLVEFGARMLERVGVNPLMGKLILVIMLGATVVGVIGACIALLASHITSGPESIVVLLQRMADAVDKGRSYMPTWAHVYLPANIGEWQVAASDWLRRNAVEVSMIGRDIGGFLIHLIFGMIIGGMIALNPAFQFVQGPFAEAMQERINLLNSAFRRIVFSQIRISALNTLLTGIFLAIIMPALGMALPLVKTMIAVTFVVGLLPIIGNLISNTVIFLIGLSVSPVAAVCALTFLIVIHKLEYFINAKIIGSQIRARAWEILLSMVFMEAAFGLVGMVAAPIYYAYIKDELKAQKLI